MIPYILYLGIIAFCSLIISVVATLTTAIPFISCFGYSWMAIVSVILVDAITATACRLLPKKCANHEKKFFTVSKKEKNFYEKLKIHKWKDLVPEIGQFTGFRKNKLENPQSVEYIERFLLEACYGEIGHFTSFFTGFLILLLFPLFEGWLIFSIPVAVINLLMNAPSYFILRYNAYKLEVLRASLLKKQRRAETKKEA